MMDRLCKISIHILHVVLDKYNIHSLTAISIIDLRYLAVDGLEAVFTKVYTSSASFLVHWTLFLTAYYLICMHIVCVDAVRYFAK